MPETTTEVRRDIETTRARMSGAIAELERKVDVSQKVKENPWIALGIAFGAGVVLSASRVDVRAAKVTTAATKETGSKLGGALDVEDDEVGRSPAEPLDRVAGVVELHDGHGSERVADDVRDPAGGEDVVADHCDAHRVTGADGRPPGPGAARAGPSVRY